MPRSSCSADRTACAPLQKEDFLKVLPRRREYFKSLGLVSSKIESLEESHLDSRYVLAGAVWQMRRARHAHAPADIAAAATYILSATGGGLEIVCQIDHQDLAKRAQEL